LALRSLSLWAVLAALSLLYFLCAPIPILLIKPSEGMFFKQVAPVGQAFILRYIHSVERTPVEDEYTISNGTFWQWEERVRSHNAGLPLLPSETGKFFAGKDWFRFRGGRQSFDVLFLRVGNAERGRNELNVVGIGKWELYKQFPGEKMEIRVIEDSLLNLFAERL